MNPAVIIREATADGLSLTLSPTGTLKATGDVSAVNRWLPILKAYKPEILVALKEAANDTPIPVDLENLICRAGTFWEYSPEDYEIVRDLARRDPDGLRLALESDKWLAQEMHEAFEERAAIMEFDGGMTRKQAEVRAGRELRGGYTWLRTVLSLYFDCLLTATHL